MRKFISFSAFAVIVILSLLLKNTAEAQVVIRPRVVVASPIAVRPICPGPGYVWINNRWAYHHYYRPRFVYGPRFYGRPFRGRRFYR